MTRADSVVVCCFMVCVTVIVFTCILVFGM